MRGSITGSIVSRLRLVDERMRNQISTLKESHHSPA